MAQGLHKHGGIRTALLTLLLSVALWQVPGCLIPPDVVEDPDNQPPELDWKRSTPEGFEYTFDRSKGQSVEFSIANAVTDPEADPLFFVWYREVPDDGPKPEVGSLTMTLYPCDNFSLRNAKRVNVAVWVSDEPLEFDTDAELFPISYGSRPPAARFWTVELLGECP
ncbi:MAG: hypothetical protein ABIK09_04820 [Pseudomonadota bacterium]